MPNVCTQVCDAYAFARWCALAGGQRRTDGEKLSPKYNRRAIGTAVERSREASREEIQAVKPWACNGFDLRAYQAAS